MTSKLIRHSQDNYNYRAQGDNNFYNVRLAIKPENIQSLVVHLGHVGLKLSPFLTRTENNFALRNFIKTLLFGQSLYA